MSQRIRIKLKSHDHNLVDKSAQKIVNTIKLTGAVVSVEHEEPSALLQRATSAAEDVHDLRRTLLVERAEDRHDVVRLRFVLVGMVVPRAALDAVRKTELRDIPPASADIAFRSTVTHVAPGFAWHMRIA